MSKVPEAMIPDDHPVIGEHRCPGCGDRLPEPSVPYGKVEYDGEIWHRECAYADSDSVERVETARRCQNCDGESKWHPKDAPEDVRLCYTCGARFVGPVAQEPTGPPFDRTDTATGGDE